MIKSFDNLINLLNRHKKLPLGFIFVMILAFILFREHKGRKSKIQSINVDKNFVETNEKKNQPDEQNQSSNLNKVEISSLHTRNDAQHLVDIPSNVNNIVN